MAVIVEYWLAGYFGRAWLRLRERGQSRPDDRPAACRVVARGGALPAGQLWNVQAFAAAMWFRVGMASAVLFGVMITATAALPDPGVRSVIASCLLVLPIVAAVSIAQMAMIGYRRNQTQRYVLRGGQRVASQVPGKGFRGLPRARDFWVILVVTLAGAALIFYSASHPSA
jgi:hypothetical protein